MIRVSVGGGTGSDFGNDANSVSVSPNRDGIGSSGMGSLIGASASAAAGGAASSADRTAAIVSRHQLGFDIAPTHRSLGPGSASESACESGCLTVQRRVGRSQAKSGGAVLRRPPAGLAGGACRRGLPAGLAGGAGKRGLAGAVAGGRGLAGVVGELSPRLWGVVGRRVAGNAGVWQAP